MRGLASILLVLALAGCLTPTPTPASPTGTPTGTPPPAEVAQECRGGAGPVFLSSVSGGGFVPQGYVPRVVEITHEGELRAIQTYTRAGSGRVSEEPEGAARGLDDATILGMLDRANITIEGRDVVVTNATWRLLSADEFETFCDRVADAFPDLAREYPNTNCADQGSTTLRLSLSLGEKEVFVDDCAERAELPRGLIEDLRTLAERQG